MAFNRHLREQRLQEKLAQSPNPKTYTAELIKALGPAEALRLATETCGTAKSVYKTLETNGRDLKEFKGTVEFWSQVYGLVKKQVKVNV